MTVYGFAKYHAQRRATERTYAPHEMDQMREEFERGVVVDHLDGVVGEAEIEKAEQQCLADDRAVNASKTSGAYDDMRDRFALQQELNRGGA